VRQTLEVELPLRDLFQRPTISQLASLIEDVLAMELDELSDEEAEQLLRDEF
jgi:hypothetical protein